MLSTDSRIFEEGSAVRGRMVEYGKLFNTFSIIVYTKPGFKEELLSSGVHFYPTNSKNIFFYFWSAYRVSRKIIKVYGDTVITSQDAMTSIVALALKSQFSFPLQVQIHTDFASQFFKYESLNNFIRHYLYRLSIRYADCVRVVSKRIYDSLVKCQMSNVKCSVLPIYVDVEKIRNTPITADLHKKYPQFDFIILVASRLTREKNIPLAIRVFHGMVRQYSKTGLVIVGEGREKRKIESEIKNYELGENIFVENWMSEEKLISYYKTADAYLLTSNYEGYSRSLIEAAASGCPIVTTDVGIAGEVFRDDQSALVCMPGDSACIENALLRLRSEKDLSQKLSQGAKTAALAHVLPKDIYMREFRTSFTQCLSSNPKK